MELDVRGKGLKSCWLLANRDDALNTNYTTLNSGTVYFAPLSSLLALSISAPPFDCSTVLLFSPIQNNVSLTRQIPQISLYLSSCLETRGHLRAAIW